MAKDYYNLVVTVIARYEVTKTETELVKIMTKKANSLMYTKMVIEHLNLTATSHDLEEICQEISEVQRLTKATGAGANTGGWHNNQDTEVQLTSHAILGSFAS